MQLNQLGGDMEKATPIKSSYQTLGEICTRLNCGHRRVKKLIQEGLPAVKVVGQYMMLEKRYLEWLEKKSK
jgi:hypothetical protein